MTEKGCVVKNYDFSVYNGTQIRQFSELKPKERAGIAQLREVLEDRLTEIKKAKTWKHERVITSPQDRKVYFYEG